MIPPVLRQRFPDNIVILALMFVMSLLAPAAYGQHGGGHAGGGAAHGAAPHPSAPAPRASAPAAPPAPLVVAPPRIDQNPTASPAASHNVTSPDVNSSRAITPDQASDGFPRSTERRQGASAIVGARAPVMFYGDGYDLWLDNSHASVPRPVLGDLMRRRHIFPLPGGGGPIYFPILYPIGIFGGFPGFGLGFGGCDPFWGWDLGCDEFGYSDYSDDLYQASPSEDSANEPEYIPQPAGDNASDNDAETVLYLKDGTTFLISDYWLAGDQVHYVSSDGVEHAIDLADIDLQKTVDENAARGVSFTLRPAPAPGGQSNGEGPSKAGNEPNEQLNTPVQQ